MHASADYSEIEIAYPMRSATITLEISAAECRARVCDERRKSKRAINGCDFYGNDGRIGCRCAASSAPFAESRVPLLCLEQEATVRAEVGCGYISTTLSRGPRFDASSRTLTSN
jgi:hypothetical protein